MATWSPPVFNLSASAWTLPNTPASGLPDYVELPTQKYLHSRAIGIDADYSESLYWLPHIIMRFPAGTVAAELSHVFECPEGSGLYYRASFREIMHEGFPNEYHAVYVCQANSTGAPVARGIVPY